MDAKQLQIIKDISIDFHIWLHENTTVRNPYKDALYHTEREYETVVMSFEDLFDLFVHEAKTKNQFENK